MLEECFGIENPSLEESWKNGSFKHLATSVKRHSQWWLYVALYQLVPWPVPEQQNAFMCSTKIIPQAHKSQGIISKGTPYDLLCIVLIGDPVWCDSIHV